MTSLMGIISLLSALKATCDGLSCTQCESRTSTSCTGISVTCSPGYYCGSELSEIISGSGYTSIYSRRCTFQSLCDLKFSISTGHERSRSIALCCDTDYCSSTIPPMPPFNANPNGVVCASCDSIITPGCNTSETIQCNGDANICFHQFVKNGSTCENCWKRMCTRSLCDYFRHNRNCYDEQRELMLQRV
ncbi:hypothetical protein GDO81_024262 [Engystomops pustulosus]|uniref:Sodefrin-like factor n=1 Tax=Engystomops pustulosus TaxID=76066 RepID=A0AAV6ZI86_ENGPU|nr:hypothetical protein GDO81_024262 [Engystomops pustulosus]